MCGSFLCVCNPIFFFFVSINLLFLFYPGFKFPPTSFYFVFTSISVFFFSGGVSAVHVFFYVPFFLLFLYFSFYFLRVSFIFPFKFFPHLFFFFQIAVQQFVDFLTTLSFVIKKKKNQLHFITHVLLYFASFDLSENQFNVYLQIIFPSFIFPFYSIRLQTAFFFYFDVQFNISIIVHSHSFSITFFFFTTTLSIFFSHNFFFRLYSIPGFIILVFMLRLISSSIINSFTFFFPFVLTFRFNNHFILYFPRIIHSPHFLLTFHLLISHSVFQVSFHLLLIVSSLFP